MVDKSDTIYVKCDGKYEIIGDGFSSKEDIISLIKEKYEDNIKEGGNVRFGICDFNKISDSESEEILYPVPNNLVPMNDNEVETLEDILRRGEKDERIDRSYRLDGRRSLARYKQNIRYDNAIDFCLRFENTVFDDETISKFDEERTEQIQNIFRDIVSNEEADYLGFDSGYAARGRRDPYTIAIGRINRSTKKERQFRQITSRDFVAGYYWNDLNLSPVPIDYNEELGDEYGYRDQDYLLIINEVSPDTDFESLNSRSINQVNKVRRDIENNFDYRVDWYGKISYLDQHDQVCLGITFTGGNKRLTREEYNNI